MTGRERTRFFIRNGLRGFSLIEVVIALTILAVSALGIIQVMRKGGIRGEAFSSEHFTAMFISQKILEDINNRVRENPHFLSMLVASATGVVKPVVDGQTVYFKLLDNTSGYTFLDISEDRPIESDQGQIFTQLKNFSCQVECQFAADPGMAQPYPNLYELTIRIFWKDAGGLDQEYQVKQRLYGIARDYYKTLDTEAVTPLEEKEFTWALYYFLKVDPIPDDPKLAAFIQENGGGDPTILKALGELLFFTFISNQSIGIYNAVINEAEVKRDSAMAGATSDSKKRGALYQQRIAQLNEQGASNLFAIARKVLDAPSKLLNSPLDASTLGPKVWAAKSTLKGKLWEGGTNIHSIETFFGAADKEYLKLLSDPYSPFFPIRLITPTIRRALDLEKMGIIIKSFETSPTQQIADLKARIAAFRSEFVGKQPIFVDYLDEEARLSQSIGSIRDAYGGSGGLVAILQKVFDMKRDFFDIEARIL